MSNLISLTTKLAARFDMEGQGVMETLKATAFKGPVSDAQMTALLIVANQYGLNPWTKEIYAFPDKNNGIVPVVGVDGWSRIINDHDEFDGMDFEQDADSCTCIIYRKDRSRPVRVTEYLSECGRNTGPWQSHPKRMLRHKAMIQCARLAFGYTGIYDQDEAEVIANNPARPVKQMGAAEVVGNQSGDDTYAAYEAETLQFLRDHALDGTAALQAAFNSMPLCSNRTQLWTKHGPELKSAAAEADVLVNATSAEVANG